VTVPEQARAGHAPTQAIVLDASAAVDLLAGNELAGAVAARLRGTAFHVPGHFAAEVLSALGRLERDGTMTAADVATALDRLAAMPVAEHPVAGLLRGAWGRRGRLRLLDALYVELAEALDVVVVTTDRRLARAGQGRVEAVAAP
jgi:predicted nucleic acid-binding protein